MRVIEHDIHPFGESFGIFVLITAMACGANIVGLYVYISHWIPPMSLVVQICRAVLLGWSVVWIWQLIRAINNNVGRIFVTIILIILSVNMMLDVWTYTVFHLPFSSDYIPAICDTHLNEIHGFLVTYLTVDFWIWITITAISIITIFLFAKRLTPVLANFSSRHFKLMTNMTVVILGLCMWGAATSSHLMGGNTDVIGKTVMFTSYNPAQKITAPDPVIVEAPDAEADSPDEIVIIVGESLSKDNCQLYGYKRNNQPKLSEMVEDKTILVFNNAKTSASYTVKTFQNIMGVWSESLPEDSVWYKCPTFFQILSSAGYHTAWISNQERRTGGGSPIATMSEVADLSFWTNDGIAIQPSYDEKVIEYIKQRNQSGGRKKLTLVHLYGSHMICKDRFPKSSKKYFAEDYGDRPSWQRETLADYDNSVLYNDFVVAEILKLYKKRDALVFYFSDHGEDLYQSNPKFYGHGMAKGTRSWDITSNIPFIIYMTSEMKRRHANLAQRIENSINNDINTTNLTYTLMDIIGVTIKGHQDDIKYSFFYQK